MTGPALPSSYSGCLRSSIMDFFTASKSPIWDPECVGVLIVPERSSSMMGWCMSSSDVRFGTLGRGRKESGEGKNNSEIYGTCRI